MLTVIYAILIFSIIIFVHEFGHFITAKMFGVYVKEFAIGMGPAIFKKQKGETLYAVRAIPIGGYCAMEGEDQESESPRSFGKKTKLQRLIILAAGAFMNLLLGFVVVLVMQGIYSPAFVSTRIAEVDPELPAYRAGVLPGDEIIKVNGYRVATRSEVDIYGSFEDSYRITVKRKSGGKTEKHEFDITPVEKEFDIEGEKFKRKVIGITFAQVGKTPLTLLEHSFKTSVFLGKLVLISIKMMLTGGAKASDISGPVGIIGEISTAAKSGLSDILFLMALITINLGLMNLLPIPALDGGRILFVIIEAIIGKPIPPKYEGLCHGIGFILLLILMVYATGNDIMRLIRG